MRKGPKKDYNQVAKFADAQNVKKQQLTTGHGALYHGRIP
jgi:hypothetical protein